MGDKGSGKASGGKGSSFRVTPSLPAAPQAPPAVVKSQPGLHTHSSLGVLGGGTGGGHRASTPRAQCSLIKAERAPILDGRAEKPPTGQRHSGASTDGSRKGRASRQSKAQEKLQEDGEVTPKSPKARARRVPQVDVEEVDQNRFKDRDLQISTSGTLEKKHVEACIAGWKGLKTVNAVPLI